MKTTAFAAAVVMYIEDDSAYQRASKRDLAIMEGVLTAIVTRLRLELQRRDKARI